MITGFVTVCGIYCALTELDKSDKLFNFGLEELMEVEFFQCSEKLTFPIEPHI